MNDDFDENKKSSFRFMHLFSFEFSFKKFRKSNQSKKFRLSSSLSAISYVLNEKFIFDKKTLLKNIVSYKIALDKINFLTIDDVFCLMFRFVIIKLKTSKHTEAKCMTCHLMRMKTMILWKFIKKSKHAWLNVDDWRRVEKLLKHHHKTRKKYLNVKLLYEFSRAKNDQLFFYQSNCLSLLFSKSL